jgi:hypothetical protein
MRCHCSNGYDGASVISKTLSVEPSMDKPLEVKPFPERPKSSQPWEPILLPSNFMRDISSGPQVALVTPQCATRIGQVITAWSSIENTLVEIMAYTIHAEEWVAAELFQDIRQLGV